MAWLKQQQLLWLHFMEPLLSHPLISPSLQDFPALSLTLMSCCWHTNPFMPLHPFSFQGPSPSSSSSCSAGLLSVPETPCLWNALPLSICAASAIDCIEVVLRNDKLLRARIDKGDKNSEKRQKYEWLDHWRRKVKCLDYSRALKVGTEQ